MTPLYGHHTSAETGYVVADYPYGFHLRCKIRFWVEYKPKKGFRFCSQTTNPKLSYEKWNAPKCSTYSALAMNMFLDDAGLLQHDGLSEYATPIQILEFLCRFPGTDVTALKLYAASRTNPNGLLAKLASGAVTQTWTINGVRQEKPEAEKERERAEYAAALAIWMQIAKKVGL